MDNRGSMVNHRGSCSGSCSCSWIAGAAWTTTGEVVVVVVVVIVVVVVVG